jgi:hypothetical protein
VAGGREPTVLYVNSQELKNITTKVLSNASGPLLRYDAPADGSGGEYELTASGVIQYYYNLQTDQAKLRYF